MTGLVFMDFILVGRKMRSWIAPAVVAVLFALMSAGTQAASIQPLPVRKGNSIEIISAGLSVYKLGSDGKLEFARKYDVDVGNKTQFWSGMVTLA